MCCFLTTLKISVIGDKGFKGKNYIVTSPYWLVTLIVWVPMMIGAFARRESTAIPWTEFGDEFEKHGLWNGILSLLIVLTVDLWLFWTPSHIYLTSKPETERKNSIFVRLFNITFGLLVTTPWNPLYKILD